MDEPWVIELRSHFPAAERVAFFDIAYENCGSDFSGAAAEAFFADKADIRPGLVKAGGAGKGRAIDVIADTRRLLAEFLGTDDPRRVAFTESTTMGLNLLLQSYPFEPGDSIVVGDLEHPAVLMPCLQLKRRGVRVHVVHPKVPLMLSAQELLEHTDSRTRMVVLSSVQSSSGYRADMETLVSVCHSRGIAVTADLIQEAGFRELDVVSLGLDACSFSGYKGLLSIEGLGMLYASEAFTESLRPVFAGDSPALEIDRESWTIREKDPGDLRKLEAGTIPFLSIYCLNAALSEIRRIGMPRIARHVSDCFDTVYGHLTGLGYEILTPREKERHCHSMIVRIGDENRAFVEKALENGVFLSAGREGCVRAAVAPFTTEGDIDRLAAFFDAWKTR